MSPSASQPVSKWMAVGLIAAAMCCLAIPAALAQAPTAEAAQSDLALRDYLSGNGLLNRGLYELAVAEYRKFLSQNAQHAKAPAARYGLAVALYRLGRCEETLAELASLRPATEFEFAAEVFTIAGQCELALKRYEAAAASFCAVAARFEGHELADDAAAGLVEALYLVGQFDQALADATNFDVRFAKSPLRERVLHFAGLADVAQKRYDEAAKRFGSLTRDYPKSPFAEQAALLLGQCLQRSEANGKAEDAYRGIIARGGKYVPDALAGLGSLFFEQGLYEEAGKYLERLIRDFADSPHVPLARFQRARIRFEQGQFHEARTEFEQLASTESFSDEAAFWSAKCSLRMGGAAGAAKRLSEAVAQFPKSELLPEMLYDRAIALLRSEDLPSAVAGLEDFRGRFAEHALAAEALRLLATTEHQRSDYAKSKGHCLRFLAEYPKHAAAEEMAFLSAENDFVGGDSQAAADGFEHFVRTYPEGEQSLKARFRLGLALYRIERYDEAAGWLQQVSAAAAVDPLLRPALLALADIHFHRGEWKQAEGLLATYVEFPDEPSADDAMLKLGLCRQRQERFDQALDVYARLLKRFPQSPHRLQATFERGQCLTALKRMDEAAEVFESVAAEGGATPFVAHALNQLAAIASSRGDAAKAAGLYAQLSQKADDDGLKEAALFQQAQALTGDGKYREAESAYDQHARRFPTGPHAVEAAVRRAIAVARQDRHADALGAMQAIDAAALGQLPSPLRAALHYEKGWCLRSLGRAEEAAAAFKDVLRESSPEGYELHALLELGGIEAGAERFDEAVAVLERLRDALAAKSSGEPALAEQCTFRLAAAQFARKNHQEALTLFEQLLADHPKSTHVPAAHYYAGEAAFHLGKHEKAVLHFTRLVKEYKDHELLELTLLRLGECLALLQRWALSEQAFSTCLDRFGSSPSAFQARFGLGWAIENQQRYDEAIAVYGKVVAGPQSVTAVRAQFQIGQCLFAQQKYEDASRELLKVDILYAYPEWSAAALFEAARCFERLGKTAEARAQLQQVEEKYKHTQWAIMAAKRLSELSSAVALPGR